MMMQLRSLAGGAPATIASVLRVSAARRAAPATAGSRAYCAASTPSAYRQAVAISSPTMIRRSDVVNWLQSLEPPVDVKPSALARRYDQDLAPLDWVVDCPDAVAALQPVVQARKQRASGGDKEQADGAAQVSVPLIGLAPPSLMECALPNAKPDHGHGGVVNHPERMVHLSGLMDVDVGYYPRDRVPLIQGWLSELGFNGVFVNTIRGQARKQRHQTAAAGDKENKKAAPGKRQLTGRYLVTLPSSAEAERLAREIHGRKYAVTSKLWKTDKEVQVAACLMGL